MVKDVRRQDDSLIEAMTNQDDLALMNDISDVFVRALQAPIDGLLDQMKVPQTSEYL